MTHGLFAQRQSSWEFVIANVITVHFIGLKQQS
jgi:hypothetical protein